MRDDEAMQRALALGQSVRRATAPNPWVGCVILSEGQIVGEGATRPPGGEHAEAVALRVAGERANGATAVVTLEPCSHQGRTGPCADALVDAGVSRVVIALEDPDPMVAGEGLRRLKHAGIEVSVGAGAGAAAESLEPYLHHRRTGRSFCVLKVATSLDGRVAAADGTSRWITGPGARSDAHGLRADSQAVVVGSGTALADRPALTVRDAQPAPDRMPLRVLLDSRGRVPAEGPLFDRGPAPTLVVTTRKAPEAVVAQWQRSGAEVLRVPEARAGVDLGATLALLGERGVLQAMVEGGPTLHGALLDSSLADLVVTYVGPTLLGTRGVPGYGLAGPATIADAPRLRLRGVKRLGDDLRIDYAPQSERDELAGRAGDVGPVRGGEET